MPTTSLTDPAVWKDPYPYYARLRAETPVHWDPEFQVWLVAHHDDVAAGLLERTLSARPDLSALDELPATVRSEVAPLRRHFESWALFSDPPEHGRVRGVLHRSLAPRSIARIRAPLERAAARLLEPAARAGGLDALHDYAMPLAHTAVAQVIGISQTDLATAGDWAYELLEFVMADPDADQCQRGLGTLGELTALVRRACARRDLPPECLATTLRVAMDEGVVSEEEAVGIVAQTLTGSLGGLGHGMANGLLALARSDGQLGLLRQRPSLTGSAVEEMLRFDTSFLLVPRLASEDLVIGGTRASAGERVWFLLGSANHDQRHFPDPDRLDIARSPNRHLAFGVGDHFCPGSALARMVLEVAVSSLVNRFPRIEVGAPVERLSRLGMRGVESLPLVLGA